MPRMGGYELARLLREDAPGMALMFVSGDPGERGMEPGDGPPPDSVILQKPFGADALLARLRDALDEHG